jgi:glycosyltransferase involved in cell wall biosynthesis
MDLLAVGSEKEYDDWVLPDPLLVSLHSSLGRFVPGLNVNFCFGFTEDIASIHMQKNLDILHDHGLWLPNNFSSAKAAHALQIPLIVSTRGMLEPWAFQYRGWKKKLMYWAWQKNVLSRAAVIHATSLREKDNLRALGLKNPVAIIPNGVDLPELKQIEKKDIKTALFLSRVHPVKGLMNLVKAWEKTKPHGWRVVIAGPSEAGHESEIKRAIEDAGLIDQFVFSGSIDEPLKWDFFNQADLFILPSFSENFGIVVAEALASNVPVITTKGTPWSDLITHRCGWWVDIGVDPLAEALKAAINLTDAERSEMGQRGRALVREQYSWEKISEDMLRVYEWVNNGGAPPDCVCLT